jgi:hypothetical protein
MRENIVMAGAYTDWMVKTGGYAKDMMLRDHFAGLAMQALLSNPKMQSEIMKGGGAPGGWIESSAYAWADSMIKERNV